MSATRPLTATSAEPGPRARLLRAVATGLAVGMAWYLLEAAWILLADPSFDRLALGRRFLRFLPWQAACFAGLGLLAGLLGGMLGGLLPARRQPIGWSVLALASLVFLGARAAEGRSHGGTLGSALLGLLEAGACIAGGLLLVYGVGRLLPRSLRPGWPRAAGVGWSLLFIGWLRETGALLGMGRVHVAGALAELPAAPVLLAAATTLVLLLTGRRRAGGATLPACLVAGLGLGAALAPPGLEAFAAQPRSGESRPAERPDVLVLLLDTLRSDHLGKRSDGSSPSPRFDAYAEQFFRFRRAYSSSSRTNLAMPGVMTGLSFRVVGTTLPPEATTLAERLQQAGYATYGISANPRVSAAFGYDQGFDLLSGAAEGADFLIASLLKLAHVALPSLTYRLGLADAELFYPRIAELRRRGLRLLDGSAAPTFLYLQTMDAHGPYLPPRRFLPGGYRAGDFLSYFAFLRLSGSPALGAPSLEPRLENVRQRYGAEVGYTDVELAALFEDLQQRGRWEETLVWILADHGEAFGEHGEAGHGTGYLGAPVLQVPLWLKPPRSWGLAPRVIDEPVSSYDLVPTTIALLGLAPEEHSFGRDLSDLLAGRRELGERSLIAHSEDPRYLRYSALRGPWKLDLTHYKDGRVTRQLFHLLEDPGEQRDRSQERPALLRQLEAEIERHRALERRLALDARSEELDPLTRERLKSLGYAE